MLKVESVQLERTYVPPCALDALNIEGRASNKMSIDSLDSDRFAGD